MNGTWYSRVTREYVFELALPANMDDIIKGYDVSVQHLEKLTGSRTKSYECRVESVDDERILLIWTIGQGPENEKEDKVQCGESSSARSVF